MIARERPDTDDARQLIAELDAALGGANYPPESRHGYSVDKLLQEGVAFFVMRHEGHAVGCGGVLFVGDEYAEVKRMFVRPGFQGRGFAKAMLAHLTAFAAGQGHRRLRLETGICQVEAIGLYEGAGFVRIGRFGPYWDDPLSVFMEKPLAPAT